MTKKCRLCKEIKEFNEFFNNKCSPDKKQSDCKKCTTIETRKYRQKNKEKMSLYEKKRYKEKRGESCRKYARNYYYENKDKIKEYKKKYKLKNIDKLKIKRKEYYENNKEAAQISSKKWREKNKLILKNKNLLKTYGIGLEDYHNKYKKQNGKCSICLIKYNKLCIDHCHKTGKIRDLLCEKCNKGLGLFKEKITRFKRAINYVRKFK